MGNKLPKDLEVGFLAGCYVAGGAILSLATRTEVNDFDVYPKSNQAMLDAFEYLVENNCFVVNASDRAVTFKSNDILKSDGERTTIQVMTYDDFETPEKIFANFDFSVCMAAFDCDTKQYTFHPDFYPDIATKTLRFNPGTRYPLNSLLRVNKYHAKGYFISKPELIKIAMTIQHAGMPTSWEDLEAQIGGTYGREISLLCHDREFTFDNVIAVMDEVWHDFKEYETSTADDVSGLAGAGLELMYSREPISYVVPQNTGNMQTTKSVAGALIVEGRHGPQIGEGFTLQAMESVSPFAVQKKEGTLYGYVYMHTSSSGMLVRSSYGKSNPEYSIGDTVTDPFKSLPIEYFQLHRLSHSRCMLVSFDISDVTSVGKESIRVTKYTILQEIKDGNS